MYSIKFNKLNWQFFISSMLNLKLLINKGLKKNLNLKCHIIKTRKILFRIIKFSKQ